MSLYAHTDGRTDIDLNREWFNEQERPRYAILSHTWGKTSEEVTFQELEALLSSDPRIPIAPILSKPGYRKIQEFCSEADRMGLEWAWVDTCCIDKTSSAELSEAINSMYRWYEDSVLCMALLSDVGMSDASLIEPETCAFEFRKSKWFTRGWTLQELIAPPTLFFYSNAWSCIGERLRLVGLIQEACGLPREIFAWGKKLEDFSVAQRMSWAAKRVTTRREDMAYCLLGLFHVNMPLLYGEGGAAFNRLQRKIIETSRDDRPVKICGDSWLLAA
ncbi:HET-domain-containing protein [Astrocystis sublimbata]|nr:HET-domain-containing protein [Astrocystis sublimbata]